jgi:hypothetical protein
MIRLDSEGQFRFHYEEDDNEVASALRQIFINTEVGRDYKANYNTNATGAADYTKILNAAVAIAGGPMITEGILLHALTLLIDSGEIKPKKFTPAAQLAEPEVDNRPRDKRTGKLLTEAQIAWGEMARFAETASSDAIRQRKNVDGKFREFIATNLRREMQGEIGDAVTPAGQPTTKARVSQELTDFAFKYNRESIANLRPKGGFVSLGGEQIPWATFNDLLSRATAANLV